MLDDVGVIGFKVLVTPSKSIPKFFQQLNVFILFYLFIFFELESYYKKMTRDMNNPLLSLAKP